MSIEPQPSQKIARFWEVARSLNTLQMREVAFEIAAMGGNTAEVDAAALATSIAEAADGKAPPKPATRGGPQS